MLIWGTGMAAQRESALRTAVSAGVPSLCCFANGLIQLERSETALKQANERSGKFSGAERKLEDLERIHADEKRRVCRSPIASPPC
jgi:hypothetical protein